MILNKDKLSNKNKLIITRKSLNEIAEIGKDQIISSLIPENLSAGEFHIFLTARALSAFIKMNGIEPTFEFDIETTYEKIN